MFSPPSRVNLQDNIFLKRINHWPFVLFSPMLIFFKNDVFSEWWKRHFRRSRNQNFLCCPTMVGRRLKHFLKILFMNFTFWWWYPCKFLERGKKYLQNVRGNKKFAVYHKSVWLDNLFGPIDNNTLNYHQLWRIKSTCGVKVGCPFWTSLVLPLNSKIGPDHKFCTNSLFNTILIA